MYTLQSEMSILIDGMQNRTILTPGGEYYTKASIRNWKSKLKSFSDYKENINLNEIDHKWCEDYKLHLLSDGYAKNSIGNILTVLKAFIWRMYNDGKMKYNGRSIRAGGELTTAVITTIDEIKELLRLDLSSTPGYERVRDIYVCQSFLGLRVSDMSKLIKDMQLHTKFINSVEFIEIETGKTGAVVCIPLHPIVKKIAQYRNYDLGNSITQQYYHFTIRQIIRLAKIDREVIFRRTEGGERKEIVVKYSSLVGSHTARRTFASNAYLAGVSALDIMAITGHKSFNSFYRYIRCENTAVAIRLADHDFFKIDLL